MVDDVTKLSEMTSAPAVLVIDGASWFLSPFDLDDQGALDRFVENYPIERARRLIKALGKDLTPHLEQKIWSDAVDAEAAQKLTLSAMTSAECLRLQLYLSLHHRQPNITIEQVSKMATMERRNEIELLLDLANGIKPDKSGKEHSRPAAEPAIELTGRSSLDS